MDHKNHLDPICGMRVEKSDAAGEYEHKGVMYYFDSDECMAQFYENPEQYAGLPGKGKRNDVRQGSEPVKKELER